MTKMDHVQGAHEGVPKGELPRCRVAYLGVPNERDGHRQTPLHASTVGARLLVPHAATPQVHTLQGLLHRLRTTTGGQ